MGTRILGWLKVPDIAERKLGEEDDRKREEQGNLSGMAPPPLSCLGHLDDLPEIVGMEGIRGAVVAVPQLGREAIARLIDEVQHHVLSVYVVPIVSQVRLVNSELIYLFYEEIFLLGIHNNLKSRLNRPIKSFLDSVLALLLCIPHAPLKESLRCWWREPLPVP